MVLKVNISNLTECPAIGDCLAKFCIYGKNDAGDTIEYARVECYIKDVVKSNEEAEVDFTIYKQEGGVLKKIA